MSDVISIDALEMRFRGCDALQGVDLHIPAGTVYALLGENGAGKTTLIRILTGFQKPTAGQCRVLGLDPSRSDESLLLRQRIGYVSDAPALYDWMTIGEIGWFASSFYPPGFLDRYREAIDRYELPSSRKIKHLSKGQRSKVALSLALAHEPELLILDEPTSGLDPIVRREFLESMITVAATGRTVFLSSHQIAEVERVADSIAILHRGRVQLVGNLADLKDSICMVTVSLVDPLIALPDPAAPAKILAEITEGRQKQLVVQGNGKEAAELWQSCPGVAKAVSRPATLEELFVACTRGDSKYARQQTDAAATRTGFMEAQRS
ncbi:MAG: ABC transporter ATP-binding protein [Planctomycetota bacterium]|jgi:ABC-2 type transport system ATP-binding protein